MRSFIFQAREALSICFPSKYSVTLYIPSGLGIFKNFLPQSKGEIWTVHIIFIFIFFNFILFLNFTILYWFCHISKWIRHRQLTQGKKPQGHITCQEGGGPFRIPEEGSMFERAQIFLYSCQLSNRPRQGWSLCSS